MKVEQIIIPNNQLSQLEVTQLVNELNIKLPIEYQKFLIDYNGGKVSYPNIIVKMQIGDFETEFYLEKFLNIQEFKNVFEIFYKKNKIGIQDFVDMKLVVIGIDNGGDNICICLSEQNWGNIFHWGGDFGAIKIAENLESFFDSLERDETKI